MNRIPLTVAVPRIAHVSADGKHCGDSCPHLVTDQVFHIPACWLNKALSERPVPLSYDETTMFLRCKLCLDSEVSR